MKRQIAALGLVVVLLSGALAALAQQATKGNVGGVSADDVTPDNVMSRADTYAKDATELVTASLARLKAEQPDVKPLVDHAMGSIGAADVRGINGIEGNELSALVNASTDAGKLGASHVQLMAFVSLSMPPDSLRKIMIDMQKAGGIVVFRGFPGNSMAAFKTQLGAIIPASMKFHNIGIDPRLFEAFRVEAVPTYIAVDKPLDLCKPLECVSSVPDFDVIRGNVPVSYALETIANGRGPGASLARSGLAQFEAQ